MEFGDDESMLLVSFSSPDPPWTVLSSQNENSTEAELINRTAGGKARQLGSSSAWSSGHVQIPLYGLIFLLTVIGNVLVIVTLMQNQRMRTVTNVFLLNLAVSDLLLGVFCMPFTLVGTLLREFIFGEAMCKAISYLQAVSVSVSAWTLVTISVERYFAICQPLRSRRWQTLSHANKMIALVWIGSFACMIPIAILSELQPIRKTGKMKCREAWPNENAEKVFNLFLNVILLVFPIAIMSITYTLISVTLWKELKADPRKSKHGAEESLVTKTSSESFSGNSIKTEEQNSSSSLNRDKEEKTNGVMDTLRVGTHNRGNTYLRRSNQAKNLSSTRRVIKMLFAVVFEFFVCWTPLYVINTVSLFDPHAVYGGLGVAGISFCQLMAYASSCCNPITYCFMNSRFRHAFISVFSCKRTRKEDPLSKNSNTFSLKTSSFYAS